MKILCIDPGTTESGYAILDDDLRPVRHGKVENTYMLQIIDKEPVTDIAIEMISSYGTNVGASTFETCVWIGRFIEAAKRSYVTPKIKRILRRDVKKHLCDRIVGINDKHIKTVLVDRFAFGEKNYGKGTKANPGWFYGVSKDAWQAIALGVTYADMKEKT